MSFSKEHLAKFYPRILFLTLFRQNLGHPAAQVAEYLKTICPLLSSLHDGSSFNRKSVAFCTCVIRDPNIGIDVIEEELGQNLIKVLREFGKIVQDDIRSIEACMDENWPKSVKVELFSATGKIEQALNLLWGDDENPDIAECERFCREMNEPAAAFSTLIERINHNEKLAAVQRTDLLTRLLADNMSEIDIPSALAILNADQSLKGDIGTFLENSYRRLVALRKDTELEAAFAESNLFESEYQRIRLQCLVLTVTQGSKCSKCGKDLNFTCVQRAPNGSLCHIQCGT
jgi:hypothetical protein